MMTSLLLENGIDSLGLLLKDMEEWMEEKEYDSVDQMRGAVSSASVSEAAAYERANYLKILQSYKP